jgi:hypothetical protein
VTAVRAAAAVLAVRLAVVAWAWDRVPPVADGTFYDTIARRIADGHGYTWLWPDGAVTYAAHYPVGYPAFVAAGYAVLGAHPGAAMVQAAALAALGTAALHVFVAEHVGRRAAVFSSLAFGLHPALVSYTPALMTEGITATLLAITLMFLGRALTASGRVVPWAACAFGLAIAAATYVRPQCIVFAVLLPLAVAPRLRKGVAVAAIACACVAAAVSPWTLRNCDRMGHCALVSVNGGWNLLIGTDPEAGGTWAPVQVPPSCTEVWDEAGKDACFGAAARRTIAADPWSWLRMAPRKLELTFDYFGAGPWYLHAASPSAFPASAKTAAAVVEIVWHRALLGAALLALARRGRGALPLRTRRRAWRVGGWIALGALVLSGWIATLVCGTLAAALGWRGRGRPAAVPLAAAGAVILATAATHAVFFGAGRYGLLVIPAICTIAAGLGDEHPF